MEKTEVIDEIRLANVRKMEQIRVNLELISGDFFGSISEKAVNVICSLAAKAALN